MATTFTLWHPVVQEDRKGCGFDVKPHGFSQLNRGSRELIEGFLDALKIDATPSRWRVDPFCSPYYRDDMESDNWLDKYPMAWHVRVRFSKALAKSVPPIYLGPYPSDAEDSSWEGKDDPWSAWEWSSCLCVVIADFWDDQWDAASNDFKHEQVFRACRKIDHVELVANIVEGRFDMGELHFPADETRVDALVQACASRAFSVRWDKTLHQFEARP